MRISSFFFYMNKLKHNKNILFWKKKKINICLCFGRVRIFLFPFIQKRNSPTERNIWEGNWGFITKAISSERKASDL